MIKEDQEVAVEDEPKKKNTPASEDDLLSEEKVDLTWNLVGKLMFDILLLFIENNLFQLPCI